jgi:AcrR family transcriptional regulator
VAIEPLAVRLGATKGSAYWHFANREELVRATLELWERRYTDAVIKIVEEGAQGPGERLRRLFATVLTAEHPPEVELALLASKDDPLVGAALQRVTQRRIDYLARLFQELGFTRAAAKRRAVLSHAIYLGQAQLMRSSPEVLPGSAAARRVLLDDALRTMMAP